MAFRSGFISIIGRPNAGKSTLLNALVGDKVAIVTRKPQTTRTRIQGIVNVQKKGKSPAGQLVFIDTPGIHKPVNSLNRRMMKEVHDALDGCDLLLIVVDATHRFEPADLHVVELAKRSGVPLVLAINKIDAVAKERLLPIIARYSDVHQFVEVIPISALKKSGLDTLLVALIKLLPEGPRYFPADQVTDQPERFLASELIREQVLMQTSEEVPHATAVTVDLYEEGTKLIRIAATIYVEREGQKAIIIGRHGATLKKVGTAARLQIERLLNSKVFLELFVKVQPNWRESKHFVEEIDWRRQLEHLGSAQRRIVSSDED